ncbi:MAG: hypothetical protein ACQUHE_14145 [Bacteroidia bacterium]
MKQKFASLTHYQKLFKIIPIIGAIMLLFIGCKKEHVIDIKPTISSEKPNPLSLADSIYFEVDGKAYALNNIFSSGIYNGGAGMRQLDKPVAGMRDWGFSGGKSVYAPVDSIYFSYFKAFSSSKLSQTVHVYFGKGFHTRDMNKFGTLWCPKDIRKILQKGEQEFATDYRSSNSIDGVYFAFNNFGSSGMPEFTFDAVDKYPQGESNFEIINTEQINENYYRIQAKFKVNIYDGNRGKHSVTKGFLRLTISRDWLNARFF